MYCKRCGEEIDDDSRFCKACGMQLPPKSTSVSSLDSTGEGKPSDIPVPRTDYFHRHEPKPEPQERRRLSDYGHLWGILLLLLVLLLFWWLR